MKILFIPKVNSIVVPTDDALVKVRLREMKEPICERDCSAGVAMDDLVCVCVRACVHVVCFQVCLVRDQQKGD